MRLVNTITFPIYIGCSRVSDSKTLGSGLRYLRGKGLVAGQKTNLYWCSPPLLCHERITTLYNKDVIPAQWSVKKNT